ncbi:hypothetical protein BGW37DRAFT_542935 [Umbelopsis sp. PMI_123]|nr:hypothetical protein BGW37DRAFT_542935 [Umbelopsis sp. PMI_123]
MAGLHLLLPEVAAKVLKRNICLEADILCDMITVGITDAVKHHYLQSLQLDIHPHLINHGIDSELFEFTIAHPKQDGDHGVLAKAIAYMNSHLQKMENLSDNQYLSLKLIYNNETPANYKAPGFTDIQTTTATKLSSLPIYQLRTSDNCLMKSTRDRTPTLPKTININMTAVDDTIDILSDSSTMDDNNPSSIDMTSKVSNIICEAYDIPIDVMKVVCPTLVVPKPERASRSNHSQHAPKCSNMAEGNSQSCETSTDVFIKVEDKIDYKLDGDTKCMCYAKTVESENMIQCHKCSDWSHEVCYGYWDKTISTLGQTTHLCFGCKKADGIDIIQARGVQNKLRRTGFLSNVKAKNPQCMHTDELDILRHKLINPRLLLGPLNLEVDRSNSDPDVMSFRFGTEQQSHESAVVGNQDSTQSSHSTRMLFEYDHLNADPSISDIKVALSELTLALL